MNDEPYFNDSALPIRVCEIGVRFSMLSGYSQLVIHRSAL